MGELIEKAVFDMIEDAAYEFIGVVAVGLTILALKDEVEEFKEKYIDNI